MPKTTLYKIVAVITGVITFLFMISVVLATLVYKFIMGGQVVIPSYTQLAPQSAPLIKTATPPPFTENTRKLQQFQGTIISDPTFAKENDLPGPWYWLLFDEPYLLEENAAGVPMYIEKLQINEIAENVNIKNEKLEEYVGKHVKVAGYLGWGYAESTVIEPISITLYAP